MQPENSQAFISKQLARACIILYHYRIIVAVAFAFLLLLSSCKKLAAASGDRGALEELFEENFLNKNFVVHYASDEGQDLTSQYTGYTFVLTKNASFYEGPLTGTKNGITYTGTWSSNDDYSKLIINLNSPSIPAEFVFLNRAWRFTKKAVPIMELAPWGSTAQKVLHMERL
jgi:hypothetical protein